MKFRAGLRAGTPILGPAPALADHTRAPRITLRVIRRGIARHRRSLAAFCAAAAVISGLRALASTPAQGHLVVAAARDIPAGTALTIVDVETVALPESAVPDGSIDDLRSAIGSTTTGPLRRGEPLTDVRIAQGPLAPPAPGLVAAPVRIADAEAAALLKPGEHIDVLAASTASDVPTTASPASIVAADVAVVDVPQPRSADAVDPTVEGALVVLATTPEQARALAQAEVSARLAAVVVG